MCVCNNGDLYLLIIFAQTDACFHYAHGCTLTVRCTPRPDTCILTCASTVSHQVVSCITTVGGSLSQCCSSSVINLAIDWISQSATVHNCQWEGYSSHTSTRVQNDLYLSWVTGIQLANCAIFSWFLVVHSTTSCLLNTNYTLAICYVCLQNAEYNGDFHARFMVCLSWIVVNLAYMQTFLSCL